MNWYIQALRKYAEFNGRARHSEYWSFAIFNFLIIFFITFIEFAEGSYGILGALYALAVIIPGFAVTIRRLHDTGRSGWYILLALIPLIGGLILLIFMLQDNCEEVNEYGVYPK
jgi:uncharacterized membrane protein YhaH (DUF805 family)